MSSGRILEENSTAMKRASSEKAFVSPYQRSSSVPLENFDSQTVSIPPRLQKLLHKYHPALPSVKKAVPEHGFSPKPGKLHPSLKKQLTCAPEFFAEFEEQQQQLKRIQPAPPTYLSETPRSNSMDSSILQTGLLENSRFGSPPLIEMRTYNLSSEHRNSDPERPRSLRNMPIRNPKTTPSGTAQHSRSTSVISNKDWGSQRLMRSEPSREMRGSQENFSFPTPPRSVPQHASQEFPRPKSQLYHARHASYTLPLPESPYSQASPSNISYRETTIPEPREMWRSPGNPSIPFKEFQDPPRSHGASGISSYTHGRASRPSLPDHKEFAMSPGANFPEYARAVEEEGFPRNASWNEQRRPKSNLTKEKMASLGPSQGRSVKKLWLQEEENAPFSPLKSALKSPVKSRHSRSVSDLPVDSKLASSHPSRSSSSNPKKSAQRQRRRTASMDMSFSNPGYYGKGGLGFLGPDGSSEEDKEEKRQRDRRARSGEDVWENVGWRSERKEKEEWREDEEAVHKGRLGAFRNGLEGSAFAAPNQADDYLEADTILLKTDSDKSKGRAGRQEGVEGEERGRMRGGREEVEDKEKLDNQKEEGEEEEELGRGILEHRRHVVTEEELSEVSEEEEEWEEGGKSLNQFGESSPSHRGSGCQIGVQEVEGREDGEDMDGASNRGLFEVNRSGESEENEEKVKKEEEEELANDGIGEFCIQASLESIPEQCPKIPEASSSSLPSPLTRPPSRRTVWKNTSATSLSVHRRGSSFTGPLLRSSSSPHSNAPSALTQHQVSTFSTSRLPHQRTLSVGSHATLMALTSSLSGEDEFVRQLSEAIQAHEAMLKLDGQDAPSADDLTSDDASLASVSREERIGGREEAEEEEDQEQSRRQKADKNEELDRDPAVEVDQAKPKEEDEEEDKGGEEEREDSTALELPGRAALTHRRAASTGGGLSSTVLSDVDVEAALWGPRHSKSPSRKTLSDSEKGAVRTMVLPLATEPQAVQCQWCLSVLAVPDNLGPSRNGFQKLRCGKCLQVSKYLVAQAEDEDEEVEEVEGVGGAGAPTDAAKLELGFVSSDNSVRTARVSRQMLPCGSARDLPPRKSYGSDGEGSRQLPSKGERRWEIFPKPLLPQRRMSPEAAMPGGVLSQVDPPRRVWVNGRIVPEERLVEAEKSAGPVQSGRFWYDARAGFWGVMGGPCLGIIPSGIPEFSSDMEEGCAGGTSNVWVNGRCLHERDLLVLRQRGLRDTAGRWYLVDHEGQVADSTTGEVLQSLGRLQPSLEKKGRGSGMRQPKPKQDERGKGKQLSYSRSLPLHAY